ncbi:hypothetical protein [Lentzea sp. E54]|uniref:hypothetical protein n=1 Tax=Lentzea xerophila TaxID=3435883 RepID=UPI003DA53C2E
MSMPLQVRTDPPKPEDVRASYGFVALIAQQIPEIGTLMEQAVREQWTPDRFSLSLANTNWWKNTPDAVRQWTVKNIADPMSAQQELLAGADKIRNLSAALGLPQPDVEKAKGLYLHTRMFDLDEIGTKAHLTRQLLGDQPGQVAGVYGDLVTGMWKLAAEYGYNTPDMAQRIHQEARNIMGSGGDTGRVGLTSWQGMMQNYAASKYGAFADRFRAGETVMDVARPYLDTYAQTLELNVQDVGLNDNLVQKALQGDGQAAQPVWQFQQELRKDERYGYTSGARQEAGKTLQAIGRAFGMVG